MISPSGTIGMRTEGGTMNKKRMDKGGGLTDCTSFIVMQRYDVTDALTTDGHFQQAGFRALLLEEIG